MAEQDYAHGSMDITAQERTYAGFLKISTRAVITFLVVLVFIALVNA